MSTLQIITPRWALPLLAPARYKGAVSGRGLGKSHFFAELLIEEHTCDPDQQSVCIREIQKSLKFSVKKLLETKIKAMGVGHMFEVTQTEIRSRGGEGIIIFQGMQDHTADSIKSLEGFDRAWAEEAQSLSHRSIELLLPTMRKPGSEVWFSWNRNQPDDAVEQLAKDMVIAYGSYLDNPFPNDEIIAEAERHRKSNPDTFEHVWMGGFNTKSEAQVFNGKFRTDEFEPGVDWDGPYCGLDFGFAQDPTAAVKCWIFNNKLFVDYEAGAVGLELDDTTSFIDGKIAGFGNYVIRGDSARPESISYLKRHGMDKIVGVDKWKGSVEDGIGYMRSFDEIVLHVRCRNVEEEFRLYSYKTDRYSGDIMPQIVDKHNHYIDAIRYALGPMIKQRQIPITSGKINFAA